MLRVAQDHLGDPDLPRRADRLAQQHVGALGPLAGLQVIRRLEVPLVDFLRIDEVEDVDRLRLLERRGLEVVLGEDDELPLRVLVALDEVLPRDGLAFLLADALVLAPALRPWRAAAGTSAGDRAWRCTARPGYSPGRTRSSLSILSGPLLLVCASGQLALTPSWPPCALGRFGIEPLSCSRLRDHPHRRHGHVCARPRPSAPGPSPVRAVRRGAGARRAARAGAPSRSRLPRRSRAVPVAVGTGRRAGRARRPRRRPRPPPASVPVDFDLVADVRLEIDACVRHEVEAHRRRALAGAPSAPVPVAVPLAGVPAAGRRAAAAAGARPASRRR